MILPLFPSTLGSEVSDRENCGQKNQKNDGQTGSRCLCKERGGYIMFAVWVKSEEATYPKTAGFM